MADNVNQPAHYTAGDIECIDAIHAALGADGFRAYCLGNVIKYNWRHRLKNGAEDLRKARVYQDWAIAGHPGAKPQAEPHHAITAPMPPHDSSVGQVLAEAQFEAACSGPALNHAGGDIAE